MHSARDGRPRRWAIMRSKVESKPWRPTAWRWGTGRAAMSREAEGPTTDDVRAHESESESRLQAGAGTMSGTEMLTDAAESGDHARDATGVALSVRGVRKTFEAELAPVRALRGVDLDVADGEFLAIMGPSGCG